MELIHDANDSLGLIYETEGMSYNIMVMARAKGDDISPKMERNGLTELLSKMRKADSLKDTSDILDSFFTLKEKRLIFRRIAILDLLSEGKTYSNIKKSLEVSRNTISKVRDIMEKRGYGRNPERKRVYSPLRAPKKKKEHILPQYRSMRSVL